jgi:hypothetical protein
MKRRAFFQASAIAAGAAAALASGPRRVFCAVVRPDPPPYMGKWRYNHFYRYTASGKKAVLHHLVETGEAERLLEISEQDCKRGECPRCAGDRTA